MARGEAGEQEQQERRRQRPRRDPVAAEPEARGAAQEAQTARLVPPGLVA
jgi:hypothetical protein